MQLKLSLTGKTKLCLLRFVLNALPPSCLLPGATEAVEPCLCINLAIELVLFLLVMEAYLIGAAEAHRGGKQASVSCAEAQRELALLCIGA